MKISIAQTKSLKGKIKENIQNHLRFIEHAIRSNSDLIIFPELSISNYEPGLVKDIAVAPDTKLFDPFQELANKHKISICIGMPTQAKDGIRISMFIFQANKERLIYSKQILDSDERDYFLCGMENIILELKGHKIALGICFETLQRTHFWNAKQNGADIYLASVAKPQAGIDKALIHYPEMAEEFNMPILMANCIGPSDNYLSAGQSAVWNRKGLLLKKLKGQNQGLLYFDTESEDVGIEAISEDINATIIKPKTP